jgi:hypothetical protein
MQHEVCRARNNIRQYVMYHAVVSKRGVLMTNTKPRQEGNIALSICSGGYEYALACVCVRVCVCVGVCAGMYVLVYVLTCISLCVHASVCVGAYVCL